MYTSTSLHVPSFPASLPCTPNNYSTMHVICNPVQCWCNIIGSRCHNWQIDWNARSVRVVLQCHDMLGVVGTWKGLRKNLHLQPQSCTLCENRNIDGFCCRNCTIVWNVSAPRKRWFTSHQVTSWGRNTSSPLHRITQTFHTLSCLMAVVTPPT
jgi:hypothetical protein